MPLPTRRKVMKLIVPKGKFEHAKKIALSLTSEIKEVLSCGKTEAFPGYREGADIKLILSNGINRKWFENEVKSKLSGAGVEATVMVFD